MAESYARRVEQVRRDKGIMHPAEKKRRREDMLIQAGLNVAQQGIGALTGGLIKSEGFRQATTPDRMLREEAAKRALERRLLRAQGGLMEGQTAAIPYDIANKMYQARINPFMEEGGRNWRHQNLMQTKLDLALMKEGKAGKGGTGGWRFWNGKWYTVASIKRVIKRVEKAKRNASGSLKADAEAKIGGMMNVLNSQPYSNKEAKKHPQWGEPIGNAGELGMISGTTGNPVKDAKDRSAALKQKRIYVYYHPDKANHPKKKYGFLATPEQIRTLQTGGSIQIPELNEDGTVKMGWNNKPVMKAIQSKQLTKDSQTAVRQHQKEIAAADNALDDLTAQKTGQTFGYKDDEVTGWPAQPEVKLPESGQPQGSPEKKEDVGKRKKISEATRDEFLEDVNKHNARSFKAQSRTQQNKAIRMANRIRSEYPDSKVPDFIPTKPIPEENK